MPNTPIADRIVQTVKRTMLDTYGGYNEVHARTTIVAVLRELDRIYHDHDTDVAQLDAGLLADDIERGGRDE